MMDAAGELFAQRHYHEVRMDDIAERAGVAKGTLYLHFKDKEALYAGLILDGMNRLAERIERGVAKVEGAEAKLLVFAREAIAFFQTSRHLVALSQRVEATGPAEDLRCAKGRFTAILVEILRGHPAGKDRPAADVELAAQFLGGMLKETMMNLPLPWPDDLAERLVDQFLHGFAGRPAPAPARRKRPG